MGFLVIGYYRFAIKRVQKKHPKSKRIACIRTQQSQLPKLLVMDLSLF